MPLKDPFEGTLNRTHKSQGTLLKDTLLTKTSNTPLNEPLEEPLKEPCKEAYKEPLKDPPRRNFKETLDGALKLLNKEAKALISF